MQNFSERLQMAIEKSKRPKGELAAHCGVALSTVSRWLAGSAPKAETLEMIAEFLGVEAKWLVFGGDAKPHAAESSAVREEPAVYRFTPRPPLRKPEEPTIQERLEMMEANTAAMRENMEAMRKALDELTDLFVNRKPKEEP